MNKNSLAIRWPLLVAAAWCMLDAADTTMAQGFRPHHGFCVQEDCPPARSTFGYFETTWRRWPVEQGGGPGADGRRRLPDDIPSIQPPKAREEADVAPGGRLPDASPSDVVPSDDQARLPVPHGTGRQLQLIENPAALPDPAGTLASLPAVDTSTENSPEEAIENVVQRLKLEKEAGATLASAELVQQGPNQPEPPRAMQRPPAVRETLEPAKPAPTDTPAKKPAPPNPRPRRNPLR